MDITKQLNLVYSDTINGKIYLGNYEPTGAILCSDSTYILSTIFSIDFPEITDTAYLRTDFKKHYERFKLFSLRQHISSGSILKLNKDLSKRWEIVFKDKRVTHIIPYDSTSFVISGERIDLNVIWVAKINSKSGHIIWMREFNVGRSLSTSGLTYAKGNFYILGETERIIPFKIQKYYGRKRIRLFKGSEMQSNLILLCVSNKGTLIWKRKLDPRRNYNYFVYNFISTNKNHYVLATYTGFNRINKKWVTDEANAFYTLKPNGRIKTKAIVDFDDMLYCDTNIVFIKTKIGDEKLKIYKFSNSGIIQTDSFKILSNKNDIRVQSILKSGNSFYLYGSMQVNNKDFLVCHMTKDFHITDCRRYDHPDYNNIVSLIETYDKNLLVIGWSYKKNEESGNLYKYMNLIEFKKFGK